MGSSSGGVIASDIDSTERERRCTSQSSFCSKRGAPQNRMTEGLLGKIATTAAHSKKPA